MKPGSGYQLSEADILKISSLFGCLEDALKELIRSRGRDDDDLPGQAEVAFYEEASRTLLSSEDDDALLF